VAQMEKVLAELVQNRSLLERLRQQGMSYARERLTWDAKAQDITRVLHWALRIGPKPDFLPPKMLAAGIGSSVQIAAPSASSPRERATTKVGCE
jgi:hypothetical protein